MELFIFYVYYSPVTTPINFYRNAGMLKRSSRVPSPTLSSKMKISVQNCATYAGLDRIKNFTAEIYADWLLKLFQPIGAKNQHRIIICWKFSL